MTKHQLIDYLQRSASLNQCVIDYLRDCHGEIDSVWEPTADAIHKVMLATRETGKHGSYSYRQESEDEHLHKGIRHLLTYMIQRDGQQAKDNEDHLALGLTRIAMALAVRGG